MCICCNSFCTLHFSTGVPLLLTLFELNQFRAIAWFNGILGVTFIVLHLLMLRGESECKKCVMPCAKSRCGKGKKFEIKWMAVFVSLTTGYSKLFIMLTTNTHVQKCLAQWEYCSISTTIKLI